MKKLYLIKTAHAAPKDIHRSIMGYVIAENEEQVLFYIDKEFNCESWKYEIEDCKIVWDSESENNITIKDYLLKYKGNLEDDDWSDAYYGVTKFGWEEVNWSFVGNVDVFFKGLINSKIAVEI